MRRRLLILVTLLVPAVVGLADTPTLPEGNRIAAKVTARLAGPEDSPLRMPTDVAVDSAGRIYVADGVNNRVVQFNRSGDVVGLIDSADEETLACPTGLCVDAKDQLWIADTGNARLVVVASDGKLVQTIDLPSGVADHPTDATDVAVSPDGAQTYVVDNDNHRLLIRENQTGRWLSLGSRGQGLGRFQWPFTVATDSEGYIYVCEAIGARVQRITPKLKWEGIVGSWGVRLGQFYRPKGLATDAAGRLYVSDSTTGAVQVFGPRGEALGALTDANGKLTRFEHPMGLAVGRDGTVYVVELKAGRVAVVQVPSAKAAPTTQPDDSEDSE